MQSKKSRIVMLLTLVLVLAQGTRTYAASETADEYTKDELNNLKPGFESTDIDKSNYNVSSYTNTFSSPQTKDTTTDTTTTDTATTSKTTDSNVGNAIISTSPSTGNKGDFWGKTSDGKWILIEQGAPASGWKMVRGEWYYMDADGVMQTGWINSSESWYYLNSGGDMAYNTIVDGYYIDWSGVMQ